MARVAEELKEEFLQLLNRKESIHLSVRFSDGKLDKSYPLKILAKKQAPFNKRIHSIFLEKFGGMK